MLDARQGKILNEKIDSYGIGMAYYESDEIILKKGEYKNVYINAPVMKGYNRVVVKERIMNSPDGVNCSYCNLFNIHITTGNDNISTAIRNFADGEARVKIQLQVLYISAGIWKTL